jgi:hypothetical protein
MGQLYDLINAYDYSQFIETQKNAKLAFFIASVLGGAKTIEELTGRWINGQIMGIDQANEYFMNKAKEMKKQNGKQKIKI